MSKFLHLHEDVMSKNDNQMAITFSCMHQGTNYSRKINIIQSVKKIPFQIMCHRQRGLFLFLSFLNSSLRDSSLRQDFIISQILRRGCHSTMIDFLLVV